MPKTTRAVPTTMWRRAFGCNLADMAIIFALAEATIDYEEVIEHPAEYQEAVIDRACWILETRDYEPVRVAQEVIYDAEDTPGATLMREIRERTNAINEAAALLDNIDSETFAWALENHSSQFLTATVDEIARTLDDLDLVIYEASINFWDAIQKEVDKL